MSEHHNTSPLYPGLYERPLDRELADLLSEHPDLKATLRKIDDEATPHLYAQFIAQIVHQALRIERPERRIALINRLIELLSQTDGLDYLQRKVLLSEDKTLLLELTSQDKPLARPSTPLYTSTLHTGQGADPPLEHACHSRQALCMLRR